MKGTKMHFLRNLSFSAGNCVSQTGKRFGLNFFKIKTFSLDDLKFVQNEIKIIQKLNVQIILSEILMSKYFGK